MLKQARVTLPDRKELLRRLMLVSDNGPLQREVLSADSGTCGYREGGRGDRHVDGAGAARLLAGDASANRGVGTHESASIL